MQRFEAAEHLADGSLGRAVYGLEGSPEEGWTVTRDGAERLRVGPGYRALPVSHCGICSTDLARHHLPFPLPQVTGHEVVALDAGAPVAVEINASHAARGLPTDGWCATCRAGRDTHCTGRLVLGIDSLPGGFAPWILAPVGSVVPLPERVDALSATFVEPFAAAWHAVETVSPAEGERVAVLGPGRLGLLVLAALAACRARSGRRFEILAVARSETRAELARRLGADELVRIDDAGPRAGLADVVFETSGSPDGLALAACLARREVHLKSTTGLPSLGLAHPTELVVDELTLQPLADAAPLGPSGGVAVLLGSPDEAGVVRRLEAAGLRVLRGADAAALRAELARDPAAPFDAADVVVAPSLGAVDAAIRPEPGVERGLVRARGVIAVPDLGQARDALLAALLDRGLRVTTSRCGDFRASLPVLAELSGILGGSLGELLVSEVVPARELAAGYAAARDASGSKGVKVVVRHPDGLLQGPS